MSTAPSGHHKPSRPVLGLFAAVLAVIGVTTYVVASYMVIDLFTRPERHPVDGPPAIRASYEDITLGTSDGLRLSGWFFTGTTDRAIVVVHGRNANRREWHGRSEQLAGFLIEDGYSVVLFDLRGHGESEGSRYTLGYYERYDVAAAVDFLLARGFRRERIGLVGISMGGASALAYLTIDPRIGPMVLDSSYADVGVVMSEGLPTLGAPSFLAPGALLVARVGAGVDMDAVRPVDIVHGHPERAFLLIHCDADELVALHHVRDLRAASTNPDTGLWIAPNCLHPTALDTYPDEYRGRVLAFLRAHWR